MKASITIIVDERHILIFHHVSVHFLSRFTKHVGSTLSQCDESAEGGTSLFVMQQLFKLATVLDLADEVGRYLLTLC